MTPGYCFATVNFENCYRHAGYVTEEREAANRGLPIISAFNRETIVAMTDKKESIIDVDKQLDKSLVLPEVLENFTPKSRVLIENAIHAVSNKPD